LEFNHFIVIDKNEVSMFLTGYNLTKISCIMERWNEICYYLSEKIKPDTDEKSFERNVIEAFEF
jgi:hypothetical protein